MDKWTAIAVMVIAASLFCSLSFVSYSKSQAQVACFKAAEAVAKASVPDRTEFKINCSNL